MNILNLPRSKNPKQGFTLIELLVAMVVTMIIIGVLTAMTRVAVSGLQTAQKNTRTARIAQEVTTTVSRDLEGIIIPSNNDSEWVNVQKSDAHTGLGNAQIKNPLEVTFYSAVTDRYSGITDEGGDISLIRYRLEYRDTILSGVTPHSVFSLYRKRIDPKQAFDTKLNQPLGKFTEKVTGNDYLAENVFDFTISFNFVAKDKDRKTIYKRVPMQVDGTNSSLIIKGDGVYLNGQVTPMSMGTGTTPARLHSADISILVLSDAGMKGISKANINSDAKLAAYLKKYGKHYSKTIVLPRP